MVFKLSMRIHIIYMCTCITICNFKMSFIIIYIHTYSDTRPPFLFSFYFSFPCGYGETLWFLTLKRKKTKRKDWGGFEKKINI